MSARGSSNGRLAVFVASRFIEPVRRAIAEAFDAVFAETSEPLAELARSERVFDAIFFSLDVRMGADRIAALSPGIRALATYSVGLDHVDLEAARSRGLAVFNTPGVLGDSVAENAIFLMLGAARRATEAIGMLREGRWTGWMPDQLVGVQLGGRTLGILGMGDIGRRVAARARAFGMSILYCNRRPLSEADAAGAGYRPTPEALVADSDVLLVACPSTSETRGLVDEALLAHARPGLILVNIARGDIVRDDALVAALREGRLQGAGLDVFAGEPRVHPGYLELPNVFMMPHVGSATVEARMGMGRILIEALLAWQAGGRPPNQVA